MPEGHAPVLGHGLDDIEQQLLAPAPVEFVWPVFTPGLRYFLANVTGGYHLVSSAAAFRNEPFTTTTGGC